MTSTPLYDMGEQPLKRTPEEQEKISAAYVQARSSQILAWVFTVCGAGVLAIIFERRIAPDIDAAMRDVATAGLILASFLPAILLFWLSKRYERQYLDMVRQPPAPIEEADKK